MVFGKGMDEAVIDFHSQGSVEHNMSSTLAATHYLILLDIQRLFLFHHFILCLYYYLIWKGTEL